MRFISPITSYKVVAVHQETEVLADGSRRELKPGYTAEFTRFDTTDWEREVARERFKFRNIVKNLDGSLVDPVHRVSSFDTVSIKDPDMRQRVEESLLGNADFGKPEGYILVPAREIRAPWPSYDELTVQGRRTAYMVAEKNIETAAATGTPIEKLIDYERAREEKRPAVIEEYEKAILKTLETGTEAEPELVAG